MTTKEFKIQMQRMNEAYKNYYTTERLKAVWSIVADLNPKVFEKKVDKALWADYPPKIDWFQSILSSEKSKEGPPILSHDHTNFDKVVSLIRKAVKSI